MDIAALARDIAQSEGGYVDDPADPGGPTHRGVTLSTLRRLHLDLNHDGRCDTADLLALTLDQTAEIYVAEFFHRPRLSLLPEILQPSVFDMQVNSGAQAVRILQKLLNRMGFPCAVDGHVGPQTARAAAAAARAAPDHLACAYGIARRNYYYALAGARPVLRRFARRRDGGKGGWITRAERFIAPRYHLTDSQHRERTATWA
ncbi:peptidoglycan-binding protein [Gemmobacter straminiformis]|uniref:Peptidoglycan-binding protein n=2 Tax=Paragemmobacter straminiformis TaxID=2045119 RepID=A0A842I8B0_9RHOB|nr:holin-associated N-acetylmuramidase [Gemmobacter straminiformis]MBC2835597.1 peptidoglycan-binding protein [Gemmobacter straminiformis]